MTVFNLMFLCDIVQNFHESDTTLQGKEKIELIMFENIKIFMTTFDVFRLTKFYTILKKVYHHCFRLIVNSLAIIFHTYCSYSYYDN